MARQSRLALAKLEAEAVWGNQPLEAVLKPSTSSRYFAARGAPHAHSSAPTAAVQTTKAAAEEEVRRSPRIARVAADSVGSPLGTPKAAASFSSSTPKAASTPKASGSSTPKAAASSSSSSTPKAAASSSSSSTPKAAASSSSSFSATPKAASSSSSSTPKATAVASTSSSSAVAAGGPKVVHSPLRPAGAAAAKDAKPAVKRTKAEEEQAALWSNQPLDKVLAAAPAGRGSRFVDPSQRDAISSKYSPVRRKRSASEELAVPADDPWGGMSLHAVMIKAKRSRYLDKPTAPAQPSV